MEVMVTLSMAFFSKSLFLPKETLQVAWEEVFMVILIRAQARTVATPQRRG